MQCGENARECDKLALACRPHEPRRHMGSRDEAAYFAMNFARSHCVAGMVHQRGTASQYDFTTRPRIAVHSR